jgi:small subunit ribosomal protein S1
MKLIIVESPSKAKTISKYLGDGFVVRASVGHVRDLPKSNKKAVDIEHGFIPHYEIVAKKEEVIADITDKASKADEIVLATDPDREGEAIAWHIAEVLKERLGAKITKKIKRATYHEITKEAVLEIKDANKGGLILEWQGIQGFLPASQLKADHYPRVLDSDKDKILKELKKLIGQKISVMIISILPKEGKLIFSEKDNNPEEKKEILSKYTVGDDLDCEIAGIVDFGIFLKLEDGLEGLVHISELDWGLVEDPRTMFKVGEKIKAKVIEIKEGKISLSVKALKENPWKEFEGKLKKGDIIKGVVIKYNKHGALVSIKEGVAGLVHNSTFGSETALRTKLELGKTYNFQITLFEPKDHKMTLVYLEQ